MLDKDDLAGIAKVGLLPSTRKNNSANGRYFFDSKRAEICIYSYPETLLHRFRTKGKLPQLRQWYSCELSYGMQLELDGDKLHCKWNSDDLRRFISRHVLLHEIGHHVSQMKRVRKGLQPDIGSALSEKLAEHYALQMTEILFGRGTLSANLHGKVSNGSELIHH